MGKGSTTSTSSYSPPPAVSKAYTDLLALAQPQSQQPYPNYGQGQYYTAQEYQPQLVSPMTPDQIIAQQNVAQLSGYEQPYINAATQLTEQASTPIQLQQFSNQAVNQYMSPYMQDVYNSTVSNINETNAQQQQQLQSNAIAKGAYGGDRAGIAQAELARQQNLANNATLANLANTGYTSALGEFNNQQAQNAQQDYINRQLAAGAGTQLANLGGYGQNAAGQQAQLQYQMGAAQQQQDQAGLSTAYQQFLNANAYPYQQLGWLGQLVSGAATGMGGTTTGSVPSPSGLSQAIGGIGALGTLGNVFGGGGGSGGFLSGLGSGAGNFLSGLGSGLGSAASGAAEGLARAFSFIASDERMKENIEPVGKTFDGQNIYKYNYKGDPRTQIGLIAQEVEHRHPDAVHSIDGMKTVNYDAATQGAAHRGHFDAGGGVGDIGMSPQQMIPQVGNMQANPHVPALPKMDKNPNEISTDKLKDAVKGIKSLMGKSDTPTANTAPTTSAPNTDLAVDKYRGGVVGYADGGTPTDTSSDAANLAKYGDVLTQDYQNIFGRAPDTSGEQYWANQLGSGAVSQDDLIKSLISGAQGADVGAAQTYTNTQNLKQYDPILQADYQKLFGRAPDAAGEQYWANQLASGAITQDQLINALKSGAQGKDILAAQNSSYNSYNLGAPQGAGVNYTGNQPAQFAPTGVVGNNPPTTGRDQAFYSQTPNIANAFNALNASNAYYGTQFTPPDLGNLGAANYNANAQYTTPVANKAPLVTPATTTSTSSTDTTTADQKMADAAAKAVADAQNQATNAGHNAKGGRIYGRSHYDSGGDVVNTNTDDSDHPNATTVTSGVVAPQSSDAANLAKFNDILTKDYQTVLGRAPDTAGEQYWANQLASGAETEDNMLKALAAGAQGDADIAAAKKYSDSLAGKTTTTPTTTTTTDTTKTPTTTTTGTTGGTTTTTTPTTTTGKVDTTPAPGTGGKPVPVGTLATPGTQSLGDAYRNYQALAHSGQAKYSDLLAGYNNYMNARGQTSAPASTSSTTDSSSTATPTAPAAKTQATTAAPTTTKAATTTPVSNQNTSVVIPKFDPSITNVPQSTYNPGVGQDAYAQSMALQNAANAKSGLNLNFGQADPSAWKNLSAADAAKLTAGETPYTALPSNSQNPGYMANLDAVRSNPVAEAALQGAIADHIPGFTIANRGGRINGYETGGGIKNYGGMKTVKDLEQFAEDVVGSGAYGEEANVFTPTASKDILAARGGVIGYQDGGPPSDQGLAALSDDAMDNYARAISSTESGGKYNITGPVSRKGDMPYGKYQVMGSNIPSWTEAATGKRMTPQEFLNDPDAQEATFRHRFGSLVKQYGNPQDAASVWHSGVPLAEAKEQGRHDVNMTTPSYVDRFTNMLSATPNGQDLLKQINSQGSRPTDQQQLTGSQQRMQQTGVNQVPTKEGLSGALGIAMTDNQRLAAFQAFAKMASTPGSFGRGLAAAADTYASTLLAANKQQTEQAKAESDIGYKKAETAEKQLKQSGNTTQFISQTPEGGVKVESQIIRPGTTSTFGSQGQQQAPAGFTPQQGGQGAGPSAPTAPTSPEVLGPIPVEGSKPNTMSVLTELGQQAQNTGGLTDKALERSQTQYAKDSEEAYNEANVARNTRGDISTMVKAVSEIGSGGLTGFGADASARNALAQYVNTGLKSAGYNGNVFVSEKDIANGQLLSKISAISANAGSESHAARWIEQFQKTYPTQDQTETAAKKLAAGLMVNAKRNIDNAEIAGAYGKASNNMGYDLKNVYEKVNPSSLYVQAQDDLAKLMTDYSVKKTDSSGREYYVNPVSDLVAGRITPTQFDELAVSRFGTKIKNLSSFVPYGQ